jgi:phospholipid/cholesterol/gamma-HCH transport system substrate-binding protein
MSESRLAWKVGVFVLVGLVLLAALLIQFSKGAELFASTYEVLLKTKNVGGIKKGASVLMAGVVVGSVRSTELTPDGRAVVVHLRIQKQCAIHGDANFYIEQAGFLGDQYVSIIPTTNALPVLRPGALVTCEEPFNLLEAARLATRFLQRIDFTAQKLNDAVVRLDGTLLAEKNLTNLTASFANFKSLSEQALATVTNLDQLVSANADAVSLGVSNLVTFSQRLNEAAADLHELVTTNRDEVTALVKKIDSASGLVNDLLADMQAGKGLAGTLLKDARMQNQMSLVISNLTVVSSNLARFGLLYKPRPPRPAPVKLSLPFPGKPR